MKLFLFLGVFFSREAIKTSTDLFNKINGTCWNWTREGHSEKNRNNDSTWVRRAFFSDVWHRDLWEGSNQPLSYPCKVIKIYETEVEIQYNGQKEKMSKKVTLPMTRDDFLTADYNPRERKERGKAFFFLKSHSSRLCATHIFR